MRFQDIPTDILTVRVKPTNNDVAALTEQPVFTVSASVVHPDEFEIRLKNLVLLATPVVKTDVRRLNSELAWGRAVLAQLANPAADGSIELQIAFFAGECLEMGNVQIGVDEYAENAFVKTGRGRSGLQGVGLYAELETLCCFRQGETAFFFLTAGPAIDDVLKLDPVLEGKGAQALNSTEDTEDTEHWESFDPHTTQATGLGDATQAPKPDATRTNSFCVTGDSIRFVATETPVHDGKAIFAITRLTKLRSGSDRALRLAKGQLAFVDWREAGRIQFLAKAQMTALTRDNDSYLKKWDEFGDLEGEILLRKAREIGALHYSDPHQGRASDDGKASVSVLISESSDSALKALKTGNAPEVQIVSEVPDYLKNGDLTFKDFVAGLAQEVQSDEFVNTISPREAEAYLTVSEFDPDSRRLTLATETLPTESGLFILSLAGEIAQITRRMEARRKILDGRAANPQLGPLIEEKGQIAPTRPPQKTEPLTAFVLEKIFSNAPTMKQREAIKVALETPDIALIQGPPGTGKTTVIAAILERLNEISAKRGSGYKGQILLTGFQHAAVENMIERISLNGIPVPKFGRPSGAEREDLSTFENTLEDWCGKIAAELRAQNPQISEIERETEIRNLCLSYIQFPTRTLAATLAGAIASLGVAVLGENGARRATNLSKRLSREDKLNDKSNLLLDVVRRIRIRPQSFADDGPERAVDALYDLKDVLEDSERALLDTASLWRPEDGEMPFLNALAALKKRLLVRLSARPVFRVEKRNDEVIALAEEAVKRIKTVGHSSKDAKSTALVEFLAELENNPYGMISAVADYSFAFAATCQQSVNKQMQKQKGVGRNEALAQIEYDYVIVDEAARVSPRDLMIPMVQGKRIILVGDHRQLPHIIDEEVARQMDDGEAGPDESDWLKKSMFQYLFSERLKALEENDKIIRRVTLDKQYRMHPLLGDFISRNFYERFDPSEQFGSGRPASDFTHNLPGTDNTPALWLNVPVAKGNHRRHGTSWTRPAEATAIVHQLRTWMNSDPGKNLSFGVISFYKAQADLIQRQLGRLAHDDISLRIGTVDSFQGMEFDVVFLSMVRTAPRTWQPNGSDRKLQARKLFGHLCLYNRLNVSMSRQKKLLVVAGDRDLLQHDIATEFVPGLVDFLKLCQTEGKVLQCP
jgi:hypothetical protein